MVQVGRIKKNILIFGVKYYRCTSASKHKTFFLVFLILWKIIRKGKGLSFKLTSWCNKWRVLGI